MLKIFLAEDEFVVREGIKNNIDWSSHGYEFCGEASDGELALPLIRKLMPDVLITDIKMPFMDGLELARLVKKEFPWIEIIILSGYEEFEYAKEGIKIGVAQYLTKPISGDDLIREVDSIAEKIIAGKNERALKEQFRREMEENDKKERKDLFAKLVSGDYSATDMLSMAEKLDINLSAIWYSVVLVYTKSNNHEQDEYSGSSLKVENHLQDECINLGCMIFDRDLEGKALIVTADSEDEIKEKQDKVINSFERIVSEYSNIRYFVGIGKPVNRLSVLNSSFESAEHALAYRYFTSENRVVSYEETLGTQEANDTLDIKEIDPNQIDRRHLTRFLKLGSVSEIPIFIEELLKRVGENAIKSSLFRQYIAMDAYFCVGVFVKEIAREGREVEVEPVDTGVLNSAEAMTEYLTAIISTAMEYRDSIANNKYSGLVSEAIRFIEENYGDDELSLNMLASHVNVSPNHLSTVFSQQTGKTFIKYLTEFRMDKAMELLKCTVLRSSEISEMVGYKDPHYFSYMFKKSVGMTPTKYRGGKDAEEEEV